MPIQMPEGVEVALEGNDVRVKGPLGELQHAVHPLLEVSYDKGRRVLTVGRRSEDRQSRSLHGLHRALLANKVQGVSQGFQKVMELYGTGYSVRLRGKALVLQVGFCHDVVMELPPGVEAVIEHETSQPDRQGPDRPALFTLKGIDKEAVNEFAAQVRHVRPPEPYKGKGIRYQGEYVRRKEGKALAGLQA